MARAKPSKAKPSKAKPSKVRPKKKRATPAAKKRRRIPLPTPADELELAERLAERGARRQAAAAAKRKAKKPAPKKKKAPAPKPKKPKKKPAPKKQREPRPARSRVPAAHRGLVEALEYAHEIASQAVDGPAPLTLTIKRSPPAKAARWRFLWEVIGRFGFRDDDRTYVDVGHMVSAWIGDFDPAQGDRLARLISPGVTDEANERIARITVAYVTHDGREGEYELGSAAPWSYCVAAAHDRLYDSNETRRGTIQRPGLIESYGEGANASRIVAVYVSLSNQFGTTATRILL